MELETKPRRMPAQHITKITKHLKKITSMALLDQMENQLRVQRGDIRTNLKAQ
jgi:hypothetical protein